MAMFCTLRPASSAHRSLLLTSAQRHLPSLSLQRVAKRSVTDLTGQTQAVLPPSTVRQFLKANKLPFKEGHAALTLSCPLCERETSQTVFINKTTGGLVCPPCKVHASWSEFKSWLSEKKQKPESVLSQVQHQKSHHVQQVDSGTSHLWSKAVHWSEAGTELREQAVCVFQLQHLKSEVFDKYHIHFVHSKFPSQSGEVKDLPCVAFPWYSSVSVGSGPGELIGVKVETLDTAPHRQTAVEPRHSQPGLFGWHTIPATAKEIILTAHPFDALAVHQSTGLPAVSLPAGHTHLPLELLPLLEPFERVTLWLGGGDQSRQMSLHFARKLSAERCYLVRCREESAMFDSALDALNKGLNLRQIVSEAQPFKHSKILGFKQLREEVYGEFANVDQVAGVKWKRFPNLSNILKGHRAGELTIFTGPTGSGKTTLMSEISLDLSLQGVPTLWGSFEIKNVRLAKIMLRQLSGLNLEKHLEQFPFWADRMEQLPLYFLGFHGAEDVKSVIEAMSHAAYVYDIRHVIIDNLQFMTGDFNILDRYSVQNHAVSEFRKFASARNVHVTVVIHPRKEDDFSELQTASIFGTAKASQEGDNVVILQKPPSGTKYLQVTKNRFDGDLGKVFLSFDKDSLTLSGYFKERKAGTSTRKGFSPATGVAPTSPEGSLGASHEPKTRNVPVAKPTTRQGQLLSRQTSLASNTTPVSSIKAREAVKLQSNTRTGAHEALSPNPTGTSQPVKTGTKLSELTRTRQQGGKTRSKLKKQEDPEELQDMMKFVEEIDLLG